MRASKPYATKIYEVVKHIARANSEYHHPFMVERPLKRIGLIVVTTDRGLCGGLNANLLREALNYTKQWQAAGQETDMCVIGRKGQAFYKRVGGNILASVDNLGDKPGVGDIIGVVKVMLKAFYDGRIDALHFPQTLGIRNQPQFGRTSIPITFPLALVLGRVALLGQLLLISIW